MKLGKAGEAFFVERKYPEVSNYTSPSKPDHQTQYDALNNNNEANDIPQRYTHVNNIKQTFFGYL